uniref:PRELI/MSF1 domain-containing protein n=1 Tax=Glossina palpalis gambiensis TaxID=67801 RepID=A0A1B0C1Z8_9MUSC
MLGNAIYEPHPTDSGETLLKQEASVSVRGVPLSHYLGDLLTSTISENAVKGRQGLEWVIGRIWEVMGIDEPAAKNTDDLILSTRRSLDDMTESALKSMGVSTRKPPNICTFRFKTIKY